MDRVNVYTYDTDTGETAYEGFFDKDKATVFPEETDFTNEGHYISVPTGSQFHHETLYRTAAGRWVLCRYSDYQGRMPPRHSFISPAAAEEWLLVNHRDADAVRYFGPLGEERGPGRPAIGPRVLVTLPEEMLAAIDALPGARANVIRDLVGRSLAAGGQE